MYGLYMGVPLTRVRFLTFELIVKLVCKHDLDTSKKGIASNCHRRFQSDAKLETFISLFI